MNKQSQSDISQFLANGNLIDEAVARGVRQALTRHKKLGEPVVVSKDGRAVLIPPEEIPDFDAPANGNGK